MDRATRLGCGLAAAPDVLRLGGGIGAEASHFPAEFGNGAVADVALWRRALGDAEVAAVAAYYLRLYAHLFAL